MIHANDLRLIVMELLVPKKILKGFGDSGHLDLVTKTFFYIYVPSSKGGSI